MGVCRSRAAVPPPVPCGRDQTTFVPKLCQGPGALAAKRWKKAVKKILNILRLRRAWHRRGLYLQHPWIKDLVEGLTRKDGELKRTKHLYE